MKIFAVAVPFLSVFSVFVCSIHVPGENEDKTTLTSLGIKTLGWQGENTQSSRNVSVYHNYSKISVQNENVPSYNQYQQPQTSYIQKNSVKLPTTPSKGPHLEPFSPQTTYGQEPNLNTRSAQGHGGTKSSQKAPYTTSSVNTIKSDTFHKTSGTQQSNGYKNSLELDKIIEAEKQNQGAHSVYNYDQQASTNSYNYQHNSISSPAQFLQTSQTHQHRNSESIMVPYSKCPEGATGSFVFKSSCYQFLNCWKGRGFPQNCAPGTLFNPQTLECDFASKVHCLSDATSYHSEHYTAFNTESIHKTGIGCPPEFSGVIPHRSDCSKFINCANGIEYVMDCPPGTLFSLKINNCDYPYKTECAGWSVDFGNNDINYIPEGSNINQVSDENLSGSYNKAKTSDGWTYGQHTSSGQSTYQTNNDYSHTGNQAYRGQTTNEQVSGSYGNNYPEYQNGVSHQTDVNHVYTGTQVYKGNEKDTQSTENGWNKSKQGSSSSQKIGGKTYDANKQFSGSNNWETEQQVSTVSGSYQNGNVNFQKTSNNDHSGSYQSSKVNTQGSYGQKGTNTNTQFTGAQTLDNGNDYNTGSESYFHQGSFQTSGGQSGHYNNNNGYTQNQNSYGNAQFATGSGTLGNGNDYYTGQASSSQSGYYNTNNKKIVTENIPKVQYGLQEGADHTPRCPYGASGLFPHPTICAKFLNCANGQMFIQDCGPGTVFNPNSMVCDFPYNVDCSDYKNIIDVRSQPNPTYKQTTHNPQQSFTTENGDLSEGASSYIPTKYAPGPNTGNNNKQEGGSGTQKFICPNQQTSFYPYPTACEKYIACMSGRPLVFTCPAGTVFDPVEKICDDSEKVNCYGSANNIKPHQSGEKINPYDQNSNTQNGGITQETYNQNTVDIDETNKGIDSSTHKGNGDLTGAASTNIGHNTNAGTGGINCPNHAIGFYPHPTDCSKYFTCSSGKPTVYKCATRTVFNPSTKVCDVPQRVNCNTDISSNWQISSTDNQNSNSATGNNQGTQGSYNHIDSQNSIEHNHSNAHQNGGSEHNEIKTQEGPLGHLSKFKEVCSTQDFYCDNNLCIPKSMECDGTKDCPNGIDEANCGRYLDQFIVKENSVLAIREKERYSALSLSDCAKSCVESKGFECKSFSYRNDAECFLSDSNVGLCGALIEAAPYKYYELAALTLDCTGLHKCPNNKCINDTQLCDGVNDCGDRSDEKGCEAETLGYEIRLAGTPNKHAGRIELKAFGKWGYICDDRFGMRDADVVCRELGFPLGALEIKGNSYYAKEVDIDNVLYLMDDVVCLGNETTIRDCDFNGWGVSNCEPQEIVGVVCKTPLDKCPKEQFKCDTVGECIPLAFVCDNVFDCPDQSDEATQHCEAPSEIRLVNGKTENEGRIEVRHHGIWGTICDDDFNDDAAKVVCNSLGYPGKATVKKDGFFGEGEGPIWLDQVFCQGNETLLQECSHWNWGEHNCEHAEDVGVICSTSGGSTKTIELDSKSKVDTSSNVVEVPAEEMFPTECGLRKNAAFYIDEVHFRVVQGSVAKKGFYPWQASLRIKNTGKPTHWCGGVVISQKFVLTAAHCLFGFSKGSYVVVAGDYNTDDEEGTEQELNAEDFYIHEDFRKGQKMNNDIALIKLKGKGFTFTKDVQPICIPESDLPYTNQLNCTISGFGTSQTGVSAYSHDLRAGWVPIQLHSVCSMPHVYGSAITEGMFCAGSLDEGVDACEGDSGGPLACLHDGVFTLYGITSWGQHCGHANKPGVYVKVAYYRNWIENTIRKNSP